MAFTNVEMAILSQMAYFGSDGCPRQPYEGESLHYTLMKNRSFLRKELGNEYYTALDNLIEKTDGEDYEIVKTSDDKYGTGFAAIAIKSPDNNVTVATRGTEGFNLKDAESLLDIAADIELAYALSTSQQTKMSQFMKSLDKEGYEGYYFTGHSLGGNLANYGAITFQPKSKVKGSVTFNAPGFNNKFHMIHQKDINETKEKITNYMNEYDIVSSVLYTVGNDIIIESSLFHADVENSIIDQIKHVDFSDHSIKALRIKDGTFEIKKEQVKSEVCQVVHNVGNPLVEMALSKPVIKTICTVFVAAIQLGRWIDGVITYLRDVGIPKLVSFIANVSSPYFKVDTAKLRSYAGRLSSVNNRLSALDRRLDSLYRKVGLRDLLSLASADIMTSYSWRISRCINYLNETANDFETTEIGIVQLF